MNTKKVCEKINITPKALRIYEELELVKPNRKLNRYRDYSDEDIIKLKEIMLLKDMGFKLDEIKTVVNKNKHESQQLVHSLYFQMKAIENKLNELENVKAALNESINEVINKNEDNPSVYFEKINDILDDNKKKRIKWIDKWSFDNWAQNYDNSVKKVSDELGIFENYQYVIDKVKDKMGVKDNLKILDIGCGTGNLCGEISIKSEVVGIDQSIEMLLIAKEKYPQMNFRVGNFLDKPYVKGYFDVIVSTYAFHHLNSHEKETAIDYMSEYLKDKGKIVIGDLMFLNKDERNSCRDKFIKDSRSDLWEIIEDEYYSDIQELKEYAEEKGLKFEFQHLVNFTWIIEMQKL